MDSLGYKYITGTNKLLRIQDSADDAIGGGYDLHNQPANNYAYDSIGNLIKDSSERISNIKWNVYGKIIEIDHKTTTPANPTKNIYYYYDAAGHRIGKKVTRGDTSAVSYTWYVRDASGNVMSTYTASIDSTQALGNSDLQLNEQHIYGSSRLGILTANRSADANTEGLNNYISPWTGMHLPYYTGKKQYELTNHLGNVLATISDKKIGVSLAQDSSLIDHYEADVQTAQDYYPFGMIMPGRMLTTLSIPGGTFSGTTQVNGYTLPTDLTLSSRAGNQPTSYVASDLIDLNEGFESGDNDDVTAYIADGSYSGGGNGANDAGLASGGYRYGFNGKEQDPEIKGSGNQYDYGLRIYDPRIGTFLSVDPLAKKFPQLTPYQYAGNSPIKFIDLDGAERYDPGANKPTGVTLIEKATVPGGMPANPHLHAGDYELVGMNNSQGKSYWIARYTYTSGENKGMYRDDYVVGTDGVADFMKNADKYLWRANMLEFTRTMDPEAGMNSMAEDAGDMWKRQAANPMTWLNIGAAMVGSLTAPNPKLPASTTAAELGFEEDVAVFPSLSRKTEYELSPNDLDWRGKGKTFNDALNEAFEKTGVDRNKFEVTKWGKDLNGKSIPVEYRAEGGAEVSVDFAHEKNGPDQPHVGWQTPGKGANQQKGHIILDKVPAGRAADKLDRSQY